MPGGIHAPLSVIATWPKPNFVNPEKRPNTILLIAFIGGPITIALMLVRLWVRIIHQRAPGWDDWMMVAASVSDLENTLAKDKADSGSLS